jgi:N-acetylglucosamine repressor
MSPIDAPTRTPPVASQHVFPKATHAQTRALNVNLVRRALYELGPISKADLSRLTGLTRTSVGKLVSQLEREGFAQNVGLGPSTGGKAPTLVALVDDARHLVSLDLGERTFSAALVNLRGTIRRRASRDLDGGNVNAAVGLVTDLIDEILGGEHQQILGISVGTPGIVERDGTIRWALNLSLGDLRLGDILRARYNLPTVVANDAWAAALATYLFRGGGRPSNLVVINVGSGIGAGLVLAGELFEGDRRGAGEIGHIVVDPNGAECHCGRRGCLETVASAPAILRAAAVAHLLGALDIREIVVHGSVTALGEPWLSAIRDEATSRSLGPLARETLVIDDGAGEDLTLVGAAAMLLTRELGLPVRW